jgi:hypothetical protein
MSHVPARRKKRSAPLTGDAIHKLMRGLFPKRNDFGEASFDELVQELARFGIRTTGQFSLLMKRHRRKLLEIDRSPMDKWAKEYYAGEFSANVKDAERKQYWFAYPALVRTAAELEWGKLAEVREVE